jgi:hypothetical protein
MLIIHELPRFREARGTLSYFHSCLNGIFELIISKPTGGYTPRKVIFENQGLHKSN